MLLAVNYSRPLADLVCTDSVPLDLFKCPAWPDLVDEASAQRPVYIHFPLCIGHGIDTALDSEQHTPVDWATRIDPLLERTHTPLVNLHLAISTQELPAIPLNSLQPAHADLIVNRAVRDAQAVTARFGAERVLIENDHDSGDRYPRPVYLADTIRRVVRETGCGLLLDISHAVRAADRLGMDVQDYLSALPVEAIREIHVTGVHRMDAAWLDRLRAAGLPESRVVPLAGRLQDHLPMTDTDWDLLDWVLGQIRRGAWGQPWVVAFEYGGVGPVWEALSDPDVLAAQVPRLYKMVHDA
jgi:uncharacterized protein (UPF0276 family)